MKPPTSIEIMCPACRAAIQVPLTLTMRRERPDDAMEVIVDVQPDMQPIEEHVCRDTGCRSDDRREQEGDA